MPLQPKGPQASPPPGLKRTDAVVGGQAVVVLSFPVAECAARLPGLTVAESAVVRLAASGLENNEIASARGVSVPTIQNQLARAFRKLGVGSRAEALAWLLARGLGPPRSGG